MGAQGESEGGGVSDDGGMQWWQERGAFEAEDAEYPIPTEDEDE